jgi:ABC-type multidrug transport system ATPase subunit
MDPRLDSSGVAGQSAAIARQENIECRNLAKSYEGKPALRDLSLTVSEGEILSLLGPNGSGKTTSTRLLATLTRADGGTASVGGHDVTRHPERVREVIGLTAQDTALDGFLTGAEYLDLVGRMNHVRQPERRGRVGDLLAEFDLVAAGGQRISTYSGGMRRRLDIAGSLISEPSVLFLDEPSTGLDPHSRARLWETVRARAATGMTVLLTTQYMDEADALADTVTVLVGGEVAATGTPHQIRNRVGGRIAEVVLANGGGARELLDLGIAAERTREEDGWIIALPDSRAATVRDLLERLTFAGIEVEDISVRAPTLDEAFRRITQEAAR